MIYEATIDGGDWGATEIDANSEQQAWALAVDWLRAGDYQDDGEVRLTLTANGVAVRSEYVTYEATCGCPLGGPHETDGTSEPAAWISCVAAGPCTGAAHGCVVQVETCACGAQRSVETNGDHSATGSWMPSSLPSA